MIVYPKLRAFLTVAETLNFTQAAAILYKSQPALSKMIAQFEAECGYQLFIRSNRSVELTYEGRLLYDKLKNTDQAILDAILEVRSIYRGKKGLLRIADGIGGPLRSGVYDGIRQFVNLYPNINVEFSSYRNNEITKTSYEMFDDVFILMDYENIYSFPYIELMCRQPILAMSKYHKLLKDHDTGELTPEMIANAEFISIYPTTSYGYNDFFLKAVSDQYGVEPRITKYVNKWLEARSNVLVKDYIRFAFDDAFLAEGETSVVLDQASPAKVIFTWNPHNTNPALKLFIEFFNTSFPK